MGPVCADVLLEENSKDIKSEKASPGIKGRLYGGVKTANLIWRILWRRD